VERYSELFLLVFGRECRTSDFAGATPYVSIDDLEVLAKQPERWPSVRTWYEDWKSKNVQACMREVAK
jgi:hypothetical protein